MGKEEGRWVGLTWKAFRREEMSFASAETISMPWEERALALSLERLRVMPRIFQDGSWRRASATPPP
jgi:hypothetical protein